MERAGSQRTRGMGSIAWLASPGPGLSAAFSFDPIGRRVGRVVNGASTSYVYDGVHVVGELSGGVRTSLVMGLGVDQLINCLQFDKTPDCTYGRTGLVVSRVGARCQY